MKQLTYIISLLLIFTSCAKGQSGIFAVSEPPIEQQYTAAAVENPSVVDDGYYNGFPMVHHLKNGLLFGIYKKASGHAPAGPLMNHTSTDGGATWTEKQIVVAGVPINCATLNLGVLANGRILISYQDDETYTRTKFAYSDNNGESWNSAGSLQFPEGYSTACSPIKMVVMPSGKVRLPYYQFGLGDNPAIIGFVNSTDNGLSWSFGENLDTNYTDAPYGTFQDWKANEIALAITHNTGNDATTKMIAILRTAVGQEGGTYYKFYRSHNGGATWEQPDTIDAGGFVDDNGMAVNGTFSRAMQYSFLPSNSPVDIIVHKDSVLVINGERNHQNGYKLKVISATRDGAFENKYTNWTRPRQIGPIANAHTLGSSIDWGYPVFFHDLTGKLFIQGYDVSTLPKDIQKSGEDRCLIFQRKIAD